jgi:UDP-2-acetamido-2-deoxy-ribo-hexuluronate aminotransferase
MAKHLIFDTETVVNWWLHTEYTAIIQTLLDTAQATNTPIWMTAISLNLLEIKSHQLFDRVTATKHITKWLDRIKILTNYGFEQIELYQQATCVQDAQIVAAVRSLVNQDVCIVTTKSNFDTLNYQITCKTPALALTWLNQTQTNNDNSLKNIHFIDLSTQQAAIRPELEQRIEQVLRHGQYILGTEVQELEAALSNYTQAKHCITVSSGTDALLLSFMALGIGNSDEVITTPFTFIATVETIALLGARPIFIDVEVNTCNLDPELIEAKITKRTKAIVPVSLYGQPANMDAINAVANKYNLPVIEDAAQSFGAEYHGRKSCNLSTIGCTSFFPSKPLGCYGDGGAIFTNDDKIAQTCRALRIHGQTQRYRHTSIGVCARMDSLQCAIILAKLPRFTWELQHRQIVAQRYHQAFTQYLHSTASPLLQLLPYPTTDCTSVFAQYTVLVKNRDKVQTKLHQANIPTAIHYPLPVTEQPAYLAFADTATVPIAKKLSQQVLSLPMGPDLTTTDQTRIINYVLASLS